MHILVAHTCMYCMYVCVYVCMHACMYVSTQVRTYVRTYVRMYVCMYVCNAHVIPIYILISYKQCKAYGIG